MKGDPNILEALNDVLAAELTAINQYFLHSKMLMNWGYKKLAAKKREESIEEMRDAEAIIDRIFYLDGLPNMQRLNAINAGIDPVEQHRCDLALEVAAVERLNRYIALCRDRGDNGTRVMLEGILRGEETAIDWLDAELRIVEAIGKERYLAEKL